MLRRPTALPAALPFVRLAVPRLRRRFRVLAATPLPPGRDGRPVGRGFAVPVAPSGHRRGDDGDSQVPGGPSCTCPVLRPRRDRSRQALCDVSMLPSAISRTSAPATWNLSGLNRTAYALAVYASQPGIAPRPRKTRFRLLARLCRMGLATHRVLTQGLVDHLIRHLLAQALPGAPRGFPGRTLRSGRSGVGQGGCLAVSPVASAPGSEDARIGSDGEVSPRTALRALSEPGAGATGRSRGQPAPWRAGNARLSRSQRHPRESSRTHACGAAENLPRPAVF